MTPRDQKRALAMLEAIPEAAWTDRDQLFSDALEGLAAAVAELKYIRSHGDPWAKERAELGIQAAIGAEAEAST